MINTDSQLIIKKICRSCMCENTEMQNIFEKDAEKGLTQLAEMLAACASIQVTSGDGLPAHLCVSCEMLLSSAFKFRQRCQKTDTTLRQFINEQIIKEESSEVVESNMDKPSEDSNSGTIRKVTSLNLFTCSYCQKVLYTIKGLKIHERNHTREKLHCHLCRAKFTSTNHLRQHIEAHNTSNSNLANYNCIECGATFINEHYLSNHKKEHNEKNTNGHDKENTVEYQDEAWVKLEEEFGETTNKQDKSEILQQNENNPIENDKISEVSMDEPTQEHSVNKTKPKRFTTKENSHKLNFCLFCEQNVLHFARHVVRHHSAERDIQKMLAYPKMSKTRKEILCSLRKRGNYLNKRSNIKPMRKNSKTGYLPCTQCLGFYSTKSLWRHRKLCNKGIKSFASSAQAEAQNFLLRHLNVDPRLRDTVFPRMRADSISMVAKKDNLICAFAAQYIKFHRESQFINVASRKMRELAKLLIELQKMKPEINNLIDGLKPNYYDILIMATKIVAKFNSEKQHYESPTYAINMGTNLRQCCEIAIIQMQKQKSAFSDTTSEEDLKYLIHLIQLHWKIDVSSQANNNLGVKNLTTISLLSLASDLKILLKYLVKTSDEAARCLNHDKNNQKAYIILLETVFCRTILLSTTRFGELQRFPLQIYESSLVNDSETREEFSEDASQVEQFLMENFKRMVIPDQIKNKVSVLFTKDVQEHIKVLLELRGNFINQPNMYLFGSPNTSESICGYNVMKKYALASKTKNPNALTCTRFIKHLAILTQLFSLTENQMEQFRKVMGHILDVHFPASTLLNEVYQIAKICKLLLLVGNSKAGEFEGKRLDEINIDLTENLFAEEDNNTDKTFENVPEVNGDKDLNDLIGEENKTPEDSSANTQLNIKTENKYKKRLLIPWTEDQKFVVAEFFKNHIKWKKPPIKSECEELKSQYEDLLKNKDWLKIKVFVQNKYTKQ